MIGDLAAGVRLLVGLRSYLRQPIDPAAARRVLAARLDGRTADFLALARRIYARARSPYRRLLAHAGCEYGDLERLGRVDGVEGTLRRLHDAGVYVSSDELKGRCPIRRGADRRGLLPRLRGRHVSGDGGPRRWALDQGQLVVPGGGSLAKVLEFSPSGAGGDPWNPTGRPGRSHSTEEE
jgi:hypothetical protein